MNRITTSVILSTSWVTLISFDHYIDKYLGGTAHLLSIILILILTIALIVMVIRQIILVIKKRHNLSFTYFIPIMIYLAIPIAGSCFNAEKLESKVVLRASYKGTQNQAYILFREDKTFELNWTGVFFYDKWYTGNWERKGDTINLKYNGDMVTQLGKKLLIKNNYLNPIGNSADSAYRKYHMFYLGYDGKGEN